MYRPPDTEEFAAVGSGRFWVSGALANDPEVAVLLDEPYRPDDPTECDARGGVWTLLFTSALVSDPDVIGVDAGRTICEDFGERLEIPYRDPD